MVELFWAHERLFDAGAGLSDVQLDVSAGGAFGSIRQTLTHIVGAQERIVATLVGTDVVGAGREREPFSGFDALRDGNGEWQANPESTRVDSHIWDRFVSVSKRCMYPLARGSGIHGIGGGPFRVTRR